MAKRIVAQEPWVAPDFVPETFGRLTTVSSRYIPDGPKRVTFQDCTCSCGKKVSAQVKNLCNGHTKSCGCYALECRKTMHITHGKYGTPEYKSWNGMWARCRSSNKNYGGRGIIVCEPSWREFAAFLADMGPMPRPGMSIERKNNDGPYCKENCEWADDVTQANNRRSSLILEYQGKTQTMTQWGTELGIPASTIQARLSKLGWSVEKSLSVPVRKCNRGS